MSSDEFTIGDRSHDLGYPLDRRRRLLSQSPPVAFCSLIEDSSWERMSFRTGYDLIAAFKHSLSTGVLYALFTGKQNDNILTPTDVTIVSIDSSAHKSCSSCTAARDMPIYSRLLPWTEPDYSDALNCNHMRALRTCGESPQCGCGSWEYYRHTALQTIETEQNGEWVVPGEERLFCVECDTELKHIPRNFS
jgi:hypothetical protein